MMHGAAQSIAEFDDALHFPSLEPVRTGMPELCRVGLSENWLLKACGHRHWLALAAAHGLRRPRFQDDHGARLYPAFTHIAINGARLDQVDEDRLLDFAVTLRRTSRTRFVSEISVTADGNDVAELKMETVFVRRAIAGMNRSASRAVVASACCLAPPATIRRSPFRAERKGEDERALATLILDPSPQEDYNGADFLYFAAFQAMLDRAEWNWFRQAERPMVTVDREIHYLGNADLGDCVRATLRNVARSDRSVEHRIDLSRCSDGIVIARATSRRVGVTR